MQYNNNYYYPIYYNNTAVVPQQQQQQQQLQQQQIYYNYNWPQRNFYQPTAANNQRNYKFRVHTAKDAGLAAAKDEELIKKSIRDIPDFPKAGILFRDISTLTADRFAFRRCIDIFVNRILQLGRVDAIGGLEARGFLFAAVAAQLNIPFVMFRKPNKLPGEQLKVDYGLEYGKDVLCIHTGQIRKGDRVVLIDDLVATGGTLEAGKKLVSMCEGEVIECFAVVELPELKGREKLESLDIPLFTIVSYEGH